ncbi:MAG TPA: hypothetical protein DSN98_00270 [Thermoplasmata archaeon]|jgi:geranylgeranyl reductase family protein|nr:MAG TPA: hypothetical protein DSN98_00270 [Thermoplasmata archaeon]
MRYDVVVIGAGPAGSTAAKFLSEKGMRVLLLDKSTFPRDKPCGGGLPARVLKRYRYIEENGLVDSFSYEVSLHSFASKYNVDIQKNEPIVAMILRKKFDAGLVNLATRSGATLLAGKTVKNVKMSEEKSRLVLTDGTEIESNYVIVADGMWGSIGKQLGTRQSCRNIGVCVFEEHPLSKRTLDQFFSEKRRVHIHMNALGVAGYGWVFPKHKHVNIGICEFRQAIGSRNEKKNIKEIYENYLKTLKETKIIPSNLKIKNPKGGVFPTYPVQRTALQRAFICGDAAGMVNPLTGEGIYNAMVSGEIAAKVITEALDSNPKNKMVISSYPVRWRNDFGKNNKRFFRLSQHWGMGEDNIMRLFEKDKQLVDIAMRHILTLDSMKTIWRKLSLRFISVYLKDRFGLL